MDFKLNQMIIELKKVNRMRMVVEVTKISTELSGIQTTIIFTSTELFTFCFDLIHYMLKAL